MKIKNRASAKLNKKQKKVSKKNEGKTKKSKQQIQNDDIQQQDDIVLSQADGEPYPIKDDQPYESVEDAKIRIAKQLLQQTKIINKKRKDDFFIEDINKQEIEEQKRVIENQNDQFVIQQLKKAYFKDRNKLYEELQDTFIERIQEVPAVYRGHTKCITGIQLSSTNIYSCSKDRSIIKWDRQTMKKDFISLGKSLQHHQEQVLCIALHPDQNLLATSGEDWLIKLWDTRSLTLIQTLKGHRGDVNGISFGGENLCSVSSDRTLKQWDIAQRSIIQTFFGHKQQALDISAVTNADFLSSGNDKQIVLWKTEKQTQVIFQGHDYAIDRVKSINQEKFITACQDGSVYLWSTKRKKPIHKHLKAHDGWIGGLGAIPQSNYFATGAIDKKMKIWSIGQELRTMKLMKEIPMEGIVTDIKFSREALAVTQCDQHRLGRWVTCKCRNKIKVYRIN